MKHRLFAAMVSVATITVAGTSSALAGDTPPPFVDPGIMPPREVEAPAAWLVINHDGVPYREPLFTGQRALLEREQDHPYTKSVETGEIGRTNPDFTAFSGAIDRNGGRLEMDDGTVLTRSGPDVINSRRVVRGTYHTGLRIAAIPAGEGWRLDWNEVRQNGPDATFAVGKEAIALPALSARSGSVFLTVEHGLPLPQSWLPVQGLSIRIERPL